MWLTGESDEQRRLATGHAEEESDLLKNVLRNSLITMKICQIFWCGSCNIIHNRFNGLSSTTGHWE